MKSFKARYLRFWKSVAKRSRRFRLYTHSHHGRLLLDMSEPTSRELWAGYMYETKHYALVEDALKTQPADVFYDIGANWGGFSLCAARAGCPRIEAFEPNRKVFGSLAANILLNNFQDRIRAWNIAAGAEDESGYLAIDPRATDVSSLSPERMPEKWDYSDRQDCLIRRMDRFLPVSGKSVFIKIDVEGHEIEVLKGLTEILQANRVRILVETLGNREFDAAAERDYGLKVLKRMGKNIYLAND